MREIVTPKNIKSILLSGESNTVEFKTSVRSAVRTLPRIISAFANSEGGVIIFGYNEKEQSVIGTSSEIEIVKSVIDENDLKDICSIYTIIHEEKTLIVLQVEKSKSLIIAGGGAYKRVGEGSERISTMTSNDVLEQILSPVKNSTISSNEVLVRLEEKIEQIYNELLRSQKLHEEELKEKKKAYEKDLRVSKRNNWFFAIFSAVLGALLGWIFSKIMI